MHYTFRTASFRTKDTRDCHTMSKALTATFKTPATVGTTLMLNLRRGEFFALMDDLFHDFVDQHPQNNKKLATYSGVQDERQIILVSPEKAFMMEGDRVREVNRKHELRLKHYKRDHLSLLTIKVIERLEKTLMI